jgi:sec-independent protein translocase protein TatC
VSASLALPLTSHLAELRNRVLISAATLATTTGFGFYQAETVIGWLKALAPRNTLFIQLTMGEVLMATLAVSLQIGLTLASPVLLYHVLRFVNPGLHRREQVMLTWTLLGGTGLFLTGVAFAYLFVLGPAIDFLLAFGQPIAHPSLSIREFIGFCSGLLLVTGLMFELPMVLFLLSFTGLITSARLIREWRWATVLIFIVAAIVTPTQDPLSLSIVGLAMVALYALSIIPIRLCGR